MNNKFWRLILLVELDRFVLYQVVTRYNDESADQDLVLVNLSLE